MKRVGWEFCLALLSAGALLCFAMVSTCHGGYLEDCIAATCRLKADDGSVGTGFLYAVGPEQTGGEQLAWIGTAAHVAVGNGVAEFGRTGVRVRVRVLWRNRNTDAGLYVAPWKDFPTPRPKPIPVAPPTIDIRVGQSLFSIGCPNGGGLMLWEGVCKGYSGGAMWFWPGPELGRSGSPIFCCLADGQPAVVGIVSARDSSKLGPNTVGRAVSIQQLRGTTETLAPMSSVWTPVQCPGGKCQDPNMDKLFGGERFQISPYRQKEQKRNDYLYERSQGGEKSQGTLPLPSQDLTPKVDLKPLEERVSKLEQDSNIAVLERAELKRRADVVKETAESVAEFAKKYDPQLKGVSDDVKAAIAASEKAAEAAKSSAGLVQSTGEKVGLVEKLAEETKGEVAKVQGELSEDNPKGLVARLKSKIEDKIAADRAALDAKLSETFIGKIAAAHSWSTTGTFIAVVAAVLALVALCVVIFKKEQARAVAGEDTNFQKFTKKTPMPQDDVAADKVADWMRGMAENQAHTASALKDVVKTVAGLATIIPKP